MLIDMHGELERVKATNSKVKKRVQQDGKTSAKETKPKSLAEQSKLTSEKLILSMKKD